jgi:hypothetical protein
MRIVRAFFLSLCSACFGLAVTLVLLAVADT